MQSFTLKLRANVFVWSMGITQHSFGIENVRAIVNLALLRRMLGREKCGLMFIRGQSGVQGGSEMGAIPNYFPGGREVNEENAKYFSKLWGFPVPSKKGFMASQLIDECFKGNIDLLYMIGGNLLEVLPEPNYIEEALKKVPIRVHQDITLTSQMLIEPKDIVILLPACTRYESKGGVSITSTERRVYFSPEIEGRRIGEAKPDWEILMLLAEKVYPGKAHLIHFEDAKAIREDIAKANPYYEGIEKLKVKGDSFQWGGERLCEGYNFPIGKAKFIPVKPPELNLPEGYFILSTRRGKQMNTIINGDYDPLIGAHRDQVLMSFEDAQDLKLKEGDKVLIRSDVGEMVCRIKIANIKPTNLQVFFPEGNRLIKKGVCDEKCGIPDYNTLVKVFKLDA
ncbi:MAG: molybdopterin-dependent oxidoreductase [Nitrososphaerales archaeon]